MRVERVNWIIIRIDILIQTTIKAGRIFTKESPLLRVVPARAVVIQTAHVIVLSARVAVAGETTTLCPAERIILLSLDKGSVGIGQGSCATKMILKKVERTGGGIVLPQFLINAGGVQIIDFIPVAVAVQDHVCSIIEKARRYTASCPGCSPAQSVIAIADRLSVGSRHLRQALPAIPLVGGCALVALCKRLAFIIEAEVCRAQCRNPVVGVRHTSVPGRGQRPACDGGDGRNLIVGVESIPIVLDRLTLAVRHALQPIDGVVSIGSRNSIGPLQAYGS